MKYIKNYKLFEMALGVPNNNVELGAIIYDRLSNLDDLELTKIVEYNQLDFRLLGEFVIGDFNFDTIKVSVESSKSDDDEINIVSFGYKSGGYIEDEEDVYYYVNLVGSTIELTITLRTPENLSITDLRSFILENKVRINSSLSHELKHAYDEYKLNRIDLKKRTEYKSYIELNFGIDVIDEFFYHLYFISSIENLVRPSEIAGAISSGEINKDQFLDFLKSNRTYKVLKDISNYSYDKMKSDLLSDVNNIRHRLEEFNIPVPVSDNDVVEFILELTYLNLKDKKFKNLSDMVNKTSNTDDLLRLLFSEAEPKFKKYLDRYISELEFKNHKDFFEFEIKRFIFVSNKLIKKISKLYDMAKDVNVDPLHSKINKKKSKKNESIEDIDLYRKVNGIKPEIKNLKK